MGNREIPFSREIYIDGADFMEVPVKKYFRLFPGNEVRVKGAYFIKCEEVIKNEDGTIKELHCTYDPATKGGNAPDGRKVKGTIHWVSAKDAVPAEFRLYDRLFSVENPGADGEDFLTQLNPDSKKIVKGFLEPEAAKLAAGTSVQFERVGYFAVDPDSTAELPVFNRTVTLKDSWSKQLKK
jgi:glutaminyl-tRNA synthetase